jgi:hypothetical protein
MTNTTTRTLPSPVTLSEGTAHLVSDHNWPQNTPLNSDHVRAHDYAHGAGGRPDLADPQVDHIHVPSPPQKKSHKGAWIGGIALLAVIGIVSGSNSSSTGGSTGASTHTVVYKVEGTTKMASITYENAAGDTAQQSDIDVPLTRSFDHTQGLVLNGMKSGAFLYISAQNSEDSGSVTCAIEIDGVRVKENTSRGGYTIATCSGRL